MSSMSGSGMDATLSPATEVRRGMAEPKKRVVKRTDAKRASEAHYKQSNQKKITVNFFENTTMDLYDYLQTKEVTPAQYIRDLIREDMERNAGK